MLVSQVTYDTKTGKTTTQMVDIPGILTDAEGKAVSDQLAQQDANEQTILGQVDAALASNATYLALANPTNAQVTAQVKALTRQVNKMIRLMRRKLDSTD